jgi:hypothetical protein
MRLFSRVREKGEPKLQSALEHKGSLADTDTEVPHLSSLLTSRPSNEDLPRNQKSEAASFCFRIALRMTVAQSSRSSPRSPVLPFAEEVSIVAVHGLGGHWKKTWTGENSKIWLRDFLPDQLVYAGVKARVMSFGYNSDTAFSKAVTNIDDEAEMLLDRLNGYRQTPEEKSRPILFISHSLGGIIMKKVRLLVSYLENLTNHLKAIIIAHERCSVYSNLLQNVRATIFFGVPHRGSDAAYWALFATRLLQFGQIGFGTNPAYVSDLRRNSETFKNISAQFIERAALLEIRTFFETEKMGNQLVKALPSGYLDVQLLIEPRLWTKTRQNSGFQMRLQLELSDLITERCANLKAPRARNTDQYGLPSRTLLNLLLVVISIVGLKHLRKTR